MQPIDLGEMEVDQVVVEGASEVPEACADRSGDGWSLVEMVPLAFEPELRDNDGSLLRGRTPAALMLLFARPRQRTDEQKQEGAGGRPLHRLKPGTACEVCGHLTNGRAELCFFHLAEWYAKKGRGKYHDAAVMLFDHGPAMSEAYGESPDRKLERFEMESTALALYENRNYRRAYEVLHNFYGEHRFGTVLPNVRELSDEELDAEVERLINAEEQFEQYLPRTLNALQELRSRNQAKLDAMAAHVARTLNFEEVERGCRMMYEANAFPGHRMSHQGHVKRMGGGPDFFFYAQHEYAGDESQGWSLRCNFIGGTASFGVFAPELEIATAKFREALDVQRKALAARLAPLSGDVADALPKEDSDG